MNSIIRNTCNSWPKRKNKSGHRKRTAPRHRISGKIEDLQEQSILAALNERPGEAYDLLQQVCYFSEQDLQYIRAVEGENADSLMYTYVKKRLENVSELQPVINFVDAVNEAEVYLISDMPNFNSYKADVLVEKWKTAAISCSTAKACA